MMAIQRELIFLVVIIVIVLVLAVALSNFTHAQEIRELHQLTKSTGSSENAHIELDGKPMAIGVIGDRIYVVIQPSNSTSVIEATNSTKMANITVGDGPMAIGVNEVSTHNR